MNTALLIIILVLVLAMVSWYAYREYVRINEQPGTVLSARSDVLLQPALMAPTTERLILQRGPQPMTLAPFGSPS